MKRLDLLILTGLIMSLVIFLTFSLQNVSNNQQLLEETVNVVRNNSEAIIENQKGIRLGAETSANNTALILSNQQALLQIFNETRIHTHSMIDLANALDTTAQADKAILLWLRNNFNETFITGVMEHEKDTSKALNEIIALLKNMSRNNSNR